MMKRQLFLVLLLTAFQPLAAVERTEAEMAAIARQQLLGAGVKGLSSMSTQMTCVKRTSSFSIYTPVQGDGFVVVSRDEAVRPVLGYSNTRFRPDNIPCGMKWWMEATEAGLRMRKKAPKLENEESMTFEPVAPMMTTKWAQGEPFNNLTPSFDDKHAPAGCVAVAMGQLLNYHRYPTSVSFTGSYFDTMPNDDYSNFQSAEINSTYSWPLLNAYGKYWPDGYQSEYDWEEIEYSKEEATQVATLIRDCGYAVGTVYTAVYGSARMTDAASALVTYYNYPQASVEYYKRRYYSNQEWMTMLHDELANGCPVMYGGVDEKNGGHAFILHGMDEDGLVYVNWGWHGSEDGYYSIDYLDTSAGNFVFDQEMTIGIRPQALSSDTPHSLFATDANYFFTWNSSEKSVYVEFTEALYFLSAYDFHGDLYIIAEDMEDGNLTKGNLFGEVDIPRNAYLLPEKYWAKMDLTPNHEYLFYMATQGSLENSPSPMRVPGGAIYYRATVDADGIPSFEEEPQPLLTGVRTINKTSSANSVTRVYDMQGHLLYASPATSFNLWDVPARGVFIVKEGARIRKVVR